MVKENVYAEVSAVLEKMRNEDIDKILIVKNLKTNKRMILIKFLKDY